jgi:lipoprotein-anchoring transpeptidase ErfK/SrfK
VRSDPMRAVLIEDRIEIDMSEFELVHYRGSRRLGKYEVGTGTPENPTPKGVFYVWASVPQPEPGGPYGVYALGLSGFAPNLTDWPGGGRTAIHGTVDPGDKGTRVSHGCVRVFNEDMRKLKGVPLGTPVVIRA